MQNRLLPGAFMRAGQAMLPGTLGGISTAAVVSTDLPTYEGTAAGASGTGDLTATMPAHLTNDILVLQVLNHHPTLTIATPATPAGWTLGASVQGDFLDVYGRHTWFWKRAASAAEAAPLIVDNGANNHTKISVIRGCITTGNPYDALSSGRATAFDGLSLTCASPTTTGVNRLMVYLVGAFTGGAGSLATWANASLANISERFDVSANVGGEFVHLALTTGEKAAAGVVGSTTATWTASYAVWAASSIAFKAS
jgi:hypothetical protein